jgi:hypothetical protein
MASERAERWGFIGVIALCGAAWYWDWDSFMPRWVWAFVGVGYGLWNVAMAVDRLQEEVAASRERVWQLESKAIDYDDD